MFPRVSSNGILNNRDSITVAPRNGHYRLIVDFDVDVRWGAAEPISENN